MKLAQMNKSLAILLTLLITYTGFSGCGQDSSNKVTPVTNPGTNAQSWSPPPVAATCTAGDADKDGSCDDVDPDHGTSANNDAAGSVDGLDLTPAGSSSHHSSDDGISPWGWALIGIGTYLTGSYVYNALEEECQFSGAQTYCVVKSHWNDPNNFMDVTESGGNAKIHIHLNNVTVNNAYWAALGSGNFKSDLQCTAEMRFSATLTKPTPADTGAVTCLDDTAIGNKSPLYCYGQTGSNVFPVMTMPTVTVQPNGDTECENGVELNCGTNYFCMEKAEFGTQNMPFYGDTTSNLRATFTNSGGPNQNGSYDQNYLLLDALAGAKIKIPQQWKRDTSDSSHAYNPNSALIGRWKVVP
jgi:hypothetical protein